MANKKVCLLCLKRFDPQVGVQNKGYRVRLLSPSSGLEAFTEEKHQGHEDLYARFLRFSSRFLKLQSSERLLDGIEQKDKEESEVIHAFCPTCFEIVSSICDLYAELNTVKTHLLWKLASIPDLVRRSKKSVSYKLSIGLMRTLSAQLNAGVTSLVGQWRKKVAFKCTLKVNTSVPRPVIHRGLFPEHWKFTEASTKQALAALIVVFLLAMSPKVENDTKPVGNQRRGRPGRKRLNGSQNAKIESSVKLETGEDVDEDHNEPDDPMDTFSNHGGSDTDWSRGIASPANAGSGSDNENCAESAIRTKRWNLRRTRKRVTKLGVGSDSEEETEKIKDKDKEFTVKKEPKKKRLKLAKNTDPDKVLSCNKCSKTFQDQRGLSKHLVAIHRVKLCYPCPICGMKFGRLIDMQTHKRKTHSTGTRYRFGEGRRPKESTCTMCEEVFPSVKAMVLHRKLNHKIRWTKHECPVCFKTVVSEQRFKKHLAAHEKDCAKSVNMHYCEVCGKHFYTESSLSEHMVKVHNSSFSCMLCDAKYPSAKFLRYHLETHETDEKKYSCTFCFKGFTNKQFYDIHRKLVHKGNRKLYCDKDKCNEEYDNIEDLNKHLRTHVLEDKKSKLLPGQSLPSRESGADEESNEGLHVCGQCGWGFLNEYNLKLHTLVHTPHKEKGTGYDCPTCGLNVRYIETLITHYNRVHGGNIKPYICEVCGNSFTSPIWYKVHMKLHCDEDPDKTFPCKMCDATFSTTVSLGFHKRKEHGFVKEYRNDYMDPASPPPNGKVRRKLKKGRPRVKPKTEEELKTEEAKVNLPCETCKECFESAYLLRKHLEGTHEDDEEKPIFCCFCYKSFCLEQTHNLHLRAVHKKLFNKFDCDATKCDEKFNSVAKLNEHLKTHENEIIPQEPKDENGLKSQVAVAGESNEESKQGNYQLPDEVNVQNVSLQNTDKPTECDPDVKTLTNKNTIKYCPTCNWGFLDNYNLELHVLSHVPKLNNKFKCVGCDVEFNGVPLLKCHYNKIHGKNIKRFECFECNKKFFSKVALHLHIHRHNRRRNDGPDGIFPCHVCGKTFKDAYLFRLHKRRHDPANHFSCAECDAKFEIRKHLQIHMKRIHGHGEKYPCPVCGQLFIYASYIQQHMRVHQEATYKCKICEKLFKRPHTLRKHMKTHDPDRVAEFICSECGMAYKSEAGLKFHVLAQHTAQELLPYSCPHCPKRYHRKMLMEAHIKTCAKLLGVNVESDKTEVPKPTPPTRPPSTRKRRQKKTLVVEPEEEAESSQTSTTESEESSESDEDIKEEDIETGDDKEQLDMYSPPSSSSTNLNTLNTIITNLTGVPLPDVNQRRKLRKPKHDTNVVKNQSTPQTSTGTAAFQATLDHMKSMCTPQANFSMPVTTQSPNLTPELQWLNSAPVPLQSPQPRWSLPLPPLPYPQLFGSNQIDQQHLQYQMYSPDSSYSYSPQDQPQNLHYSPSPPTSN